MRAIVNRVTRDDYSEGEEADGYEEEEELEREIYSEDEEEGDVDRGEDRDGDEEGEDEEEEMADDGLLEEDNGARMAQAKAPARRGKVVRKRAIKEKSPEVELNTLPPHEAYFEQHRKRAPISTNSISILAPLETSQLFTLLREHKDHEEEKEYLLSHYQTQFPQWLFELDQGFNLCLYGYGSKRTLLLKFLDELYKRHPTRKIIVVNGHVATLTIKDLLQQLLTALLGPTHSIKVSPNPLDTVSMISSLLSQEETPALTLAIHNLDGENLRSEKAQTVLSTLASCKKVSLIASIDHLRAPLLWDSARASALNLAFHEATTFQPYTLESSLTSSLELGRSGRTGGTKGVKYVLASLPTNAKELYRILISGQLEAIVEDEEAGGGRGVGEANERYGVDYRVLYQKAAEEFICSNDVAFRSLLKEYVFPLLRMLDGTDGVIGSRTMRWLRRGRMYRVRRFFGRRLGRRSWRIFWRI